MKQCLNNFFANVQIVRFNYPNECVKFNTFIYILFNLNPRFMCRPKLSHITKSKFDLDFVKSDILDLHKKPTQNTNPAIKISTMPVIALKWLVLYFN